MSDKQAYEVLKQLPDSVAFQIFQAMKKEEVQVAQQELFCTLAYLLYQNQKDFPILSPLCDFSLLAKKMQFFLPPDPASSSSFSKEELQEIQNLSFLCQLYLQYKASYKSGAISPELFSLLFQSLKERKIFNLASLRKDQQTAYQFLKLFLSDQTHKRSLTTEQMQALLDLYLVDNKDFNFDEIYDSRFVLGDHLLVLRNYYLGLSDPGDPEGTSIESNFSTKNLDLAYQKAVKRLKPKPQEEKVLMRVTRMFDDLGKGEKSYLAFLDQVSNVSEFIQALLKAKEKS